MGQVDQKYIHYISEMLFLFRSLHNLLNIDTFEQLELNKIIYEIQMLFD